MLHPSTVACFALLLLVQASAAQTEWTQLKSPVPAGFRGISVVNDNTAWFSGTGGTILKTTDRGKSIQDVSIPQIDKYDFRDIHAFSDKSAVVLNAGSPGAIYRTDNGGTTWTRVYNDTRPEIFFDAMDFWDDKNGIAFGDAIDGRLVIIRTVDGGKTWKELPKNQQPKMLPGEGGFAASGTCLITTGEKTVWIGTGSHLKDKSSEVTRLLVSRNRGESWSSVNVPIPRNPSGGIFSLCFDNEKSGVIVGGDYRKPDGKQNNLAITRDGGKTWTIPKFENHKGSLSGFRSVVITTSQNEKRLWIAGGTNGIDVSHDGGKTWKRQSDLSTNVLMSSENGVIYGAGPQGVLFKGKFKKGSR